MKMLFFPNRVMAPTAAEPGGAIHTCRRTP
jgi:hypothetical protein